MMVNSTVFKLDSATRSLLESVNTSIAISVIYMIVTVINLVGNGLSMWLLVFRTSPKTPSVIFMINLTLTDLALGVALPFQIAYQLQGFHWTLGTNMCSVMTLVFYTNMYCSILTMMAIAINRYLGVVWPMLFRKMQKKSFAFIGCLFMWGLVLSVLHPLMTTDLTFDIPELRIITCFDVLKKEMLPTEYAWLGFVFSMVFVLFLFPFCVTTFCYVSVIRELGRYAKTSKKKKAVRLAIIVLLVFTLCFAPNNILLLTHIVIKLFYKQSLYMAYKLSLCFSCLNSCLDPFIYYFACKEFRQKLRQIIHLQNLSSSVDSMKMEHKESLHSTHIAFESPEREPL